MASAACFFSRTDRPDRSEAVGLVNQRVQSLEPILPTHAADVIAVGGRIPPQEFDDVPRHMVAATLFPPCPSMKWYSYYGI